MAARGFSLVEALVGMAILGVALVGVLPSFVTALDANTISEERSDAVAAAQQVMEELRQTDPADLPDSGVSDVRLITVGSREYEALTRYCTEPDYCSAGSRHLVVEISFGGRTVYSVATVYTKLQ